MRNHPLHRQHETAVVMPRRGSCVASYLRWIGGGAGREPLFPRRPWPFLIASPLMRLFMHAGCLQASATCWFCRPRPG